MSMLPFFPQQKMSMLQFFPQQKGIVAFLCILSGRSYFKSYWIYHLKMVKIALKIKRCLLKEVICLMFTENCLPQTTLSVHLPEIMYRV